MTSSSCVVWPVISKLMLVFASELCPDASTAMHSRLHSAIFTNRYRILGALGLVCMAIQAADPANNDRTYLVFSAHRDMALSGGSFHHLLLKARCVSTDRSGRSRLHGRGHVDL
uniref:Secreted protein n=1 Tax=Rhipicephalus appendiculatus TaxID=34631 RepID=A0A131YJG3_RHIAP